MWVVGTTPLPLYPPFLLPEGPCTYCTGGWLGLGADLDGHGEVARTGIRSSYHPARSEVLYRLRCLCRPLFENTTYWTHILRVSVGRSEKPDVRPVLLTYFKINITESCIERCRGLGGGIILKSISYPLCVCVCVCASARAYVLARVHEEFGLKWLRIDSGSDNTDVFFFVVVLLTVHLSIFILVPN